MVNYNTINKNVMIIDYIKLLNILHKIKINQLKNIN